MEIAYSWFEILPVEILTMIFIKCDFQTRRLCKLVCHRWLNVLMTSHELDRHLVLDNCTFDATLPPVNIFQNAIYPYKSCELIFKLNGNVLDNKISDSFWTNIGNVKLNLKYGAPLFRRLTYCNSRELSSLLNKFNFVLPNIENIKIYVISSIDPVILFENFHKLKQLFIKSDDINYMNPIYYTKLKPLYSLEFLDYRLEDFNEAFFDILPSFFPNLKTLTLHVTCCSWIFQMDVFLIKLLTKLHYLQSLDFCILYGNWDTVVCDQSANKITNMIIDYGNNLQVIFLYFSTVILFIFLYCYTFFIFFQTINLGYSGCSFYDETLFAKLEKLNKVTFTTYNNGRIRKVEKFVRSM